MNREYQRKKRKMGRKWYKVAGSPLENPWSTYTKIITINNNNKQLSIIKKLTAEALNQMIFSLAPHSPCWICRAQFNEAPKDASKAAFPFHFLSQDVSSFSLLYWVTSPCTQAESLHAPWRMPPQPHLWWVRLFPGESHLSENIMSKKSKKKSSTLPSTHLQHQKACQI